LVGPKVFDIVGLEKIERLSRWMSITVMGADLDNSDVRIDLIEKIIARADRRQKDIERLTF
jgi:hypothetical protein